MPSTTSSSSSSTKQHPHRRRLTYIVSSVGYQEEEDDIPEEYRNALQRRYHAEQEAMSEAFEKELLKLFPKGKAANRRAADTEDVSAAEENAKRPKREKAATWHITYHTDKDKLWLNKVMEELEYENYKLYPSIEECIAEFAVGKSMKPIK